MSTATIAMEGDSGGFPRLRNRDRSISKRLAECARLLREEVRRWGSAAGSMAAAPRWLIENHSYLQFQIRETRRSLPASYLRSLPITRVGTTSELRVYRLARHCLAQEQEVINSAAVARFEQSMKTDRSLKLGELWAFGSMLKLVLIENLCADLESERVVSLSIRNLRALEMVAWRDFVENVSAVERVLWRDPARVYLRMDFATRDWYRHQVEGIARGSKVCEEEVAEKAVACAEVHRDEARKAHVGYYLIGPGARDFRKHIGCKTSWCMRAHEILHQWPSLFYICCIVLLTILIVGGFKWLVGSLTLGMAALALVAAGQAALEIVNALVSRLLPPRALPSMDFSEGIPDDCETMVVVPTLLLSEANVARLLENLEIRYLANREANLYFALLTDFPDADSAETASDSVLTPCLEGIRRLNIRYRTGESGPFYLFHRSRRWNPREARWMGYERKRGKLNDLNNLLLGRGNCFQTIAGDTGRLHKIRYVITLDADTQLPRETAAKMVAAAAHPLNRPIIDAKTRMVKEGYALIRPRVAVSMESAGRSRLAQIFSGQAGFDPYATAVSDVYQDLHGQASFIGKGIYHVRAFDAAVGRRFPENSILSHDLIEGEYARTGLLTSVELVEDYPATYEGFAKRKHRWVRGDWQLVPWLLPSAPGPRGHWMRNPLPFLSRWKIFDNLRRSVLEMCVLLLFLAGWLAAEDQLRWTLAVLALLELGAFADLLFSFSSAPERRLWPSFVHHFGERLFDSQRMALLNLIFIPHQACLMADAIFRTLVRRFITQRHLLEWEPMAQSELAPEAALSIVGRYLYLCCPAVLLYLLAWTHPSSSVGLVCGLWMAAPLAGRWLNQPPPAAPALSESDRVFLRTTALRTWRFFADHAGPEDHWLAPDTVQQDPPLTAHRMSPTNLGLLLTSYLAAIDFGYLNLEELSLSLRRIFDAVEKMPRYRGHLFNWYDTRTLQPELPHFVSTVDSGNLAASLYALRQGSLALLKRPVLEQAVLDGLRDHVLKLREELPYAARSGALMRLFASLVRQLELRPTDLLFWEAVLTEARDLVQRIHVSLARAQFTKSEELRYWESLLTQRMDAVLDELYGLAPWLDPSIEAELRLNIRDSSLAPLFRDLCSVPALAELPGVYRSIRARLIERMGSSEPLYPGLRGTLTKLLVCLPAAGTRALDVIEQLTGIAADASRLLGEMDFRFLFDARRKLLRIGYHADRGQADDSCYDLLASEARTAVFVAIAKGDIPCGAWFRLGRKLTAYRNRRTLISWSGTMFEYLMPLLHMRSYANTLLDHGLCGAIAIQKLYAAERNVPWGISEAAHAARDLRMQYQYRAFGVPAISAKTGGIEKLVVAPYASMLALMLDPGQATANLRLLASQGCVARYGFLESIEYSSAGSNGAELIGCFMAHHQGMGLLAIDNALLGGRMQERFHLDPEVQATEFLLQERMPALVEVFSEAEDFAA